jgi:hypothetical protein
MEDENAQKQQAFKELIEYYEDVIRLKKELNLPYRQEREAIINLKIEYGTDK